MTRPDRFWNADHERVARLVTGGLVAASLAAIATVEVFHSLYYDGNTRNQDTNMLFLTLMTFLKFSISYLIG